MIAAHKNPHLILSRHDLRKGEDSIEEMRYPQNIPLINNDVYYKHVSGGISTTKKPTGPVQNRRAI
jgi:hypothetical protein